MVEAEGFVVILPRRGAVVASPSSGDLADMFAVRERLETLAARLAAERATPPTWRRCAPCSTRPARRPSAQDLARVAELNSAFHRAMLQVSGNPWLLVDRRAAMYHHVQWVFRLGAAQRAPHSWAEHIRLVDAIEQATATAPSGRARPPATRLRSGATRTPQRGGR